MLISYFCIIARIFISMLNNVNNKNYNNNNLCTLSILLFPSVEAKTKYLTPLLSSTYPSALPTIRYKGFTL